MTLWNLPALYETPNVFDDAPADTAVTHPDETFPGVRQFFFDSVPYKGKTTRVFAYYGFPEGATASNKVPAMVLVHGGGGTAFPQWVKLWNDKGYAAIAIDCCGCTPGTERHEHKRTEHGGPAGWGNWEQLDEPVTDQWSYHAVAAVIRANSLMRSFEQVDENRIGLTGISWGGYLTSCVSGLDDRFAFAAPVYGCGFLHELSSMRERMKELTDKQRQTWIDNWEPSHYLPNAKLPMLWVNGTNDFAFPMASWQKSYRAVQGEVQLCMRVRMHHGHSAGWEPIEIETFADSLFRDGTPLPKITSQKVDGLTQQVTYQSDRPIVRAELNYTKDRGPYGEREWHIQPIDFDADKHIVTGESPEGTYMFYINLFDDRECVVSSEHVTAE